MGILWLLPANRAGGSISGAISGAVSGRARLAGARAAVGGPRLRERRRLGRRRLRGRCPSSSGSARSSAGTRTVFLVAGAALALDYWVFGEAFGQPFTGIATDPNTGPLLVLLALALYPNRVPVRSAADAGPLGAEATQLPAPAFSLSG